MKIKFLIKLIPLISTLLLLLLVSINNQKKYTKLRLLFWNTPTLTIGNYIAVSTGSGFLFSYLITNKFAGLYLSKSQKLLNYKPDDILNDNYDSFETAANSTYDNTLIQRDIKDPSPTIKASFRVIGRTDKKDNNLNYNNNNLTDNKDIQFYDSNEFEEQYNEEIKNNKTTNRETYSTSDWNDELPLSW
tara:strand:- start:1495 stop:2061 length:567 start_codon:yes stop_codon:yes gene_type:complete